MNQACPEDSIQFIVGGWWQEDRTPELKHGRLVRAFVPFVDQEPRQLVIAGRSDPTDHSRADYTVEPLRIAAPFRAPALPVAALPDHPGEIRAVYRAKARPCIVISAGGPEIPKILRLGAAHYQSAPAILVAPAFGVDKDGSRGGWSPGFVARIRRCEYPQYLWDMLPIRGPKESIIRLDHIQPVGRHSNSFEVLPHCLTYDALVVLQEWLAWLITGALPREGVLLGIREELLKLAS